MKNIIHEIIHTLSRKNDNSNEVCQLSEAKSEAKDPGSLAAKRRRRSDSLSKLWFTQRNQVRSKTSQFSSSEEQRRGSEGPIRLAKPNQRQNIPVHQQRRKLLSEVWRLLIGGLSAQNLMEKGSSLSELHFAQRSLAAPGRRFDNSKLIGEEIIVFLAKLNIAKQTQAARTIIKRDQEQCRRITWFLVIKVCNTQYILSKRVVIDTQG